MGIITPPTEEVLPTLPFEKAMMCISCGQCEAFCPTGALVHDPRPGRERQVAWKKGQIPLEIMSLYMKSRRSIRQYTPELVDRRTIESILDAARYAASGGNGQPVEWLVIHDPAKTRKIAGHTIEWMRTLLNTDHPMSGYVPNMITPWEQGRDVICRGAPHLVIPHIPAGNPVAPVDALIALTHVDIAAPAFGIGTCWAGFVAGALQSYVPLQEFLSLPEGRVPAYAMMLGYPRYTPAHIPERKPLSVTWQ